MTDKRASTQTDRARRLYHLSGTPVSPRLLRSVALVKIAAARCNAALGYLDAQVAQQLESAARVIVAMEDDELHVEFPIDAYQGGAGTSTNMAVNEWLVASCKMHPDAAYDWANLHQSTNDVMPTALRLMMHDAFVRIEASCQKLQTELQCGEQSYDSVQKPGRTQLREAVITTLGREYGTWAHAIARDRWRCFKARERIREVNLGGTAIGSGAGAPRTYVLQAVRYLQQLVEHPICRAEHLVEATSNYDQIAEAMGAVKCLAINLRRIASDIRLLASGPGSGFGELNLPGGIKGSSIMAGKVNPVIPEAVIQCAERIIANDSLISRLASMSELELNAFFPAIAHSIDESLQMADAALLCLADYLPGVSANAQRCARGIGSSHAEVVALLPLISYAKCEVLSRAAQQTQTSLQNYIVEQGLMPADDASSIFSPENLTSLGYDEELYNRLRKNYGQGLEIFAGKLREQAPENATEQHI